MSEYEIAITFIFGYCLLLFACCVWLHHREGG